MGKVGRKEILTLDVAKKICQMIIRLPDAGIPVNWANVIIHTKKITKHTFNRQMLSQKEWAGRKLISESFSEAKAVERRMKNDNAPKYKTSARSILQQRINTLEAKNLALYEELEKVRSQQMDVLNVFLNSRCDLQALLKRVSLDEN